jgi:hypothetical protein
MGLEQAEGKPHHCACSLGTFDSLTERRNGCVEEHSESKYKRGKNLNFLAWPIIFLSLLTQT